ncbi:MAG: MBL fold metallo-hydrolase [Burkholderiaceae bacterium]
MRILLDIGLPLDGEFGDSALMPAITEGVAAVVVSHPHVDHYGLLHHLPAGTPVCIGAAARRIIEAAAPFTGQPLPSLAGFDLQHRTPIQIGPFQITPYLVDHSAYDAYGLLVEAGGKRLFYSGDFRGHGRKGRLFEAFLQQPPSNIDVSLCPLLRLSLSCLTYMLLVAMLCLTHKVSDRLNWVAGDRFIDIVLGLEATCSGSQ